MRYYNIMTGLRGCYMPDDSFAVAVTTRRELKSVLLEQRDFTRGHEHSVAEMRADGDHYASDRDVASVAAALWRRKPTDRDSYLSTVIPYGRDASCGIQVNPIARAEYLKMQNRDD